MAIPVLEVENFWKIYYYTAIFATVVFVLKLFLFALVGGDSEVVSDFNTEMDTDCSFNFFSIQSVIAFFMGFGWMGYAGLKQLALGQYVNLAVAFCVGFIFMFVTAGLMFMVKKLEKNVRKDKITAVGCVGKAYTHFAPHSTGQIEIEINGQLTVVNALNDTDVSINSFDMVKVNKVVEDLLYIEKFNK